MPRLLIALVAAATVAGCASSVNTTSGRAFLSASQTAVDHEVAAIAAQEPNLRFPARIGLARIVDGRLTIAPVAEAALLQDFTTALAPFGSVTTISPALATTLPASDGPRAATRIAQLAAARQHLDYVLIYTLDTPARGTGTGQALFMDVRNGYVYGTAETSADIAGLGRNRQGWGRSTLSDRAAQKVVVGLLPDVADMMNGLGAASR